jgi:hypothetical protein
MEHVLQLLILRELRNAPHLSSIGVGAQPAGIAQQDGAIVAQDDPFWL